MFYVLYYGHMCMVSSSGGNRLSCETLPNYIIVLNIFDILVVQFVKYKYQQNTYRLIINICYNINILNTYILHILYILYILSSIFKEIRLLLS